MLFPTTHFLLFFVVVAGIIAALEQSDIRQRLGIITHLHGILHPDDSFPARQPPRKLGKPPDTSRMTAANRIHLDNLTFD